MQRNFDSPWLKALLHRGVSAFWFESNCELPLVVCVISSNNFGLIFQAALLETSFGRSERDCFDIIRNSEFSPFHCCLDFVRGFVVFGEAIGDQSLLS